MRNNLYSQMIFSLSKKLLKFCLRNLLNFRKNTLLVYFSFEFCPPGFDAIWYFMAAELERRKRGLKEIRVIFYCPQQPTGEIESIYHWRLHNITIPLLTMLMSTVTYSIVRSKINAALSFAGCKNIYTHDPLSESTFNLTEIHKRLCKELPLIDKPWGIKAHPTALNYVSTWVKHHVQLRKLIVITLRSSPDIPKRNSNMAEWARFAFSCPPQFYVVFVMDTETALNGKPEQLHNANFFDAASWNVHMRLALYETAFLNLSINSGPTSLCFFNPKCRFIQFKVTTADVPTASIELLESLGFHRNQNFSWATPFQKIVWEEDNYDVIQREFNSMCQKIEFNFSTQLANK